MINLDFEMFCCFMLSFCRELNLIQLGLRFVCKIDINFYFNFNYSSISKLCVSINIYKLCLRDRSNLGKELH